MKEQKTPLGQILVLLASLGIILWVLSIQPHSTILVFRLVTGKQLPWTGFVIDPRTGEETLFKGKQPLYGPTKILAQLKAKFIAEDEEILVNGEAFIVSPDRQHVAFAAILDSVLGAEIFVVDIASDRIRRLTTNQMDDYLPSWSPDGQQIAFVRESNPRDPATAQLYIITIDGTDERQITTLMGEKRFPKWSPDGQQITFLMGHEMNFQVGIIDLENYALESFSYVEHIPFSGYPNALEWSPDGHYIAYTGLGDPNDTADKSAIRIIDTVQHEERLLTEAYGSIPQITWSPDSKQIAFSARDVPDTGDQEIFIIDVSGDNLRQMTHNDVYDGFPIWRR